MTQGLWFTQLSLFVALEQFISSQHNWILLDRQTFLLPYSVS